MKKFKVTFEYTVDCETEQEGKEAINKMLFPIKPDIVAIRNARTNQQNKALHLYFTMLAEALNDAGYDMKKTLRNDIDIPWTADNVKEYMWRPVQEELLKKKSTTELEVVLEIDKIYDIINRTIGERTGIHVPFPSIQIDEH